MVPTRGLLLIPRKFNNLQFVKELRKLNSKENDLDVREFPESCSIWKRYRFPRD